MYNNCAVLNVSSYKDLILKSYSLLEDVILSYLILPHLISSCCSFQNVFAIVFGHFQHLNTE